jgi:methyltransferase
MSHVLTYLETPPHLRKLLFPMHPNLRTAGTLPSLDLPHHLRATEYCPFREGVTTKSTSEGTEVDIGLAKTCKLPGVSIPADTRVTVKLSSPDGTEGTAVSPTAPREEGGYYWGYTLRTAPSLSAVFTECAFDGGYDLSFGTSERGESLRSVLYPSKSDSDHVESRIPKYKHLIIVFGGVAGLETAAKNDPELASRGISGANVGDLFDYWLNLVEGQGSRTIRTEEAVWLGLMGLRGVVQDNGEG